MKLSGASLRFGQESSLYIATKCLVNADLVNVNSAKRARSPDGKSDVLPKVACRMVKNLKCIETAWFPIA